MRTILFILLLPFQLFLDFIIRPFAKLLLKRELEYERERRISAYKIIKELRKEIKSLSDERNSLKARLDRLFYIIKENKTKTRELHLTAKGELVVIAYDANNIFTSLSLMGENGKSPHFDCKIDLSHLVN
jgi:hypothetical protein